VSDDVRDPPLGGRVSGRDVPENRPPEGRGNFAHAHGGLRDAPSGIACARRYSRAPEAGGGEFVDGRAATIDAG
jgi:hypothetical protein